MAAFHLGKGTWEHFCYLKDKAIQKSIDARIKAQQALEDQASLKMSLARHRAESERLVMGFPRKIQTIEARVTEAEENFSSGAFTPFWDVVETAVSALADLTAEIDEVIQHAKAHKEELARFDGSSPAFRVKLQEIPDLSRLMNRINKVLQRAQRDYRFSSIFHQRRTNQILIAGFSSLNDAIRDLGDRLESSLADFSELVESGLADLSDSHAKSSERIDGRLQQLHTQQMNESEARRKHEEIQRDLLKNLQYRRGRRTPRKRE